MRASPIQPDGIFDGLRWSLIIRWAVLDIVLTVIAIFPTLFLLAGSGAFSDDEKAVSRAFDEAVGSPEFLFWSFLIGTAITVFAAFRAARAAGALHLRHGGWTAVVSAVLGSLLALAQGGSEGPSAPFWYDALSLGILLPAGVLGGWLAARGG